MVMARRTMHTVGLDIGTSKVTCIICEPIEDSLLDVIGIGQADTRGLRKGVVVNPDSAVESIKRAVEEAERMSGLEAESVVVNLAGSHLMGLNGQAVVAVSGRDREITHDDVRRAIESACAIQLPAGREIVDRLPQEFIVDDQDGINDPIGMIGARLAVKVHIVTSPITARQNAINAVNRSGLNVADMVLGQLAAAEATLTEDDKEFGSALLNIGAETTSLVIFQRGAVQHTAVFPLGGSHFTNDIAIGLRTPNPEAEKIKRLAGCASNLCLRDEERGDVIEVPTIGTRMPRQISKQILCDILQPRAEEILLHVMDEIRESGWDRQLSSGVVLTGGGALLEGMAEVAEQVFETPVRIGYPERDRFGGLIEDIQSPSWASAAGLALVGYRSQSLDYRVLGMKKEPVGKFTGLMAKVRAKFSGIL